MTLLRADGVSASYGDGAEPVLDGVSLELDEGQIVAVVGRSGCGKTTLLHVLAGLIDPAAGTVTLAGEDVTGRPGRIGYMFQDDLLLPNRTVIDNVCLPLELGGMRRDQAREQARGLLDRFGLTDVERAWPSQLSGGMRQRAALLRTYLMGTQAILLDEPFSALDAYMRRDMRAWLYELVGELGLSVVLITHDVDEAVALSDRVVVLAGEPAAGRPSTVAGVVDVPVARSSRHDFDLTDEFLACKREVMALL